MGIIRTVLGDIPASDLGVTNAHEHLFIRNGLILVKQPDFRLDSEADAITEVTDFHDSGGRAIVDTAPLGIGRDPEALALVSRSTGVHVIASTGFHKPEYYLDSHWRYRVSAEKIAELFVDEISNGMDAFGFEGPFRQRTSARAGVIKAASDYQKISKASIVGFEAAAIAHLQTGAPILTHTELGTMGAEQLDLLRKFGVSVKHVVLSHADRNPDWMLHRDLAQTGAFLEYDGPGRAKYFPESTVIELIRKMFDLGLGGQILLGGDTARRSYWKAAGGGPGIAYIVGQFAPRLRREGMLEEQISAMLIANPARVFSMSLNLQTDSR
jgi:predicted metal-dependent phosphotriesterase family hydrolase